MRRILLLIVIVLLISTASGQQIEVTNTVLLPVGDVSFAAPRFNPDGTKLLFTQSGYKGLWLYGLEQKSLEQINDYTGAGYEPIFSADGRQIIFRIDDYSKRKKYSSLAIQTLPDRTVEYIVKNIRDLSPPKYLNGQTLIYRSNKSVRLYDPSRKEYLKSDIIDDIYAYIDYQQIVVITNGKTTVLTPLGKGNYIWLSLSPDKSRLLFKLVGSGTYITDPEGNVLVELGMANAPKWSPDGNWIVYMRDEDDGHKMTASEIWAVSGDGLNHFQLTKTDDRIEMYPCWSPDMNKIAFDTDDGRIGYLEINISE